MAQNRIVVKLYDGTPVLGKIHKKYGETALTFSNRTQAVNATIIHGGHVIQRGRPFYVLMAG